MSQNSSWSVAKVQASDSRGGESGPVMAWARDVITGEPVYILELDASRKGAKSGCECPSCGLPLLAINASKQEYIKRPHFRHPNGAVQSECMYLSARLAALELLRTQGFILLPKVARSGTAVGISGTAYGAWIERPAKRVGIRDFNFEDRTAAILTLEDGRKLRFELLGNGAKIASGGGLVASIFLNLDDSDIAGMSISDLRARITLIPDGLCWVSHWDDKALSAEAIAEAEKKADDFMDLQTRYADELGDIDKKYRHETVLHWEVKNILAESLGLCVPGLEAHSSGASSSGRQVRRQWSRTSTFIPLLSVQLEKQLGSVIPDVLAHTSSEHGGILLVEVTVTNRIDPQRITKIKQQNLPALEIDLSNSGGLVSRAELKSIVIERLEHKRWLHHPELTENLARLDGEVASELVLLDEADANRQKYINQVLETPIPDLANAYLDAVAAYAEYDALDSLSVEDESAKEAAKIRLDGASDGMAIRGYPEARNEALTAGRSAIVPRVLSIKQNRAIGYKLKTTMDVMNAIMQSFGSSVSNHTIYLIAERVYRPADVKQRPDWYVAWVQKVKDSLRAEELTYERDRKFDRILSLLFPEMADALSRSTLRKASHHSDAIAQFAYNMRWWENERKKNPPKPTAKPQVTEVNSPHRRPSTPAPTDRPNLYAEMKGRIPPRKPEH